MTLYTKRNIEHESIWYITLCYSIYATIFRTLISQNKIIKPKCIVYIVITKVHKFVLIIINDKLPLRTPFRVCQGHAEK